MLTILNALLFLFLVADLITFLIRTDKNNIVTVSKWKAYICIAVIAIETISLIIRVFTAQPWFVIFMLLAIHVVISYDAIVDARDHGAFKRKKKSKAEKLDIVV